MCACVLVCVPHSCSALLLVSQFELDDNCSSGNEWHAAQSQFCKPSLLTRVEVKLQFSAAATRCRLHHKEHMASSLMGILFSALVAVLWRIRPNEIGGKKIKLGRKCVLPHTGLNEVPLASTLGTKTAERKAVKDNSDTVPK